MYKHVCTCCIYIYVYINVHTPARAPRLQSADNLARALPMPKCKHNTHTTHHTTHHITIYGSSSCPVYTCPRPAASKCSKSGAGTPNASIPLPVPVCSSMVGCCPGGGGRSMCARDSCGCGLAKAASTCITACTCCLRRVVARIPLNMVSASASSDCCDGSTACLHDCSTCMYICIYIYIYIYIQVYVCIFI